MPAFDTGGLAARAADPSLLAVLGGTLLKGTFLSAAQSRYPVTVLGYQAAASLGFADAWRHDRPASSSAAGGSPSSAS